jgi:7-cyano-7-deazaguanine synthase
MKQKKAVVVFSGGQDSTTCLYKARQLDFEVHAVTIDYGQRHRTEVYAAKRIANFANVASHEVVKLGAGTLRGTSPLVSGAELEQYADHQSLPGGLEKTFVPMRNQLFLTLAANRAYVLGTNDLFTGVCQEDFGGYPDCRRTFIDSLEATSNLGTFTGEPETMPPLHIWTPLMYKKKAAIVRMALDLPRCYEALALSHTAYDGQYPPLGHDHATLLRAKGFEEADVPDPLILRAHYEGLMDLPDARNYKWSSNRQYFERIERFCAEVIGVPESRR